MSPSTKMEKLAARIRPLVPSYRVAVLSRGVFVDAPTREEALAVYTTLADEGALTRDISDVRVRCYPVGRRRLVTLRLQEIRPAFNECHEPRKIVEKMYLADGGVSARKRLERLQKELEWQRARWQKLGRLGIGAAVAELPDNLIRHVLGFVYP